MFFLQYHEEKIQIKDAMKIGKVIRLYSIYICFQLVQVPNDIVNFIQITLTSSWTFEDFKNSIADIDIQKGVSEISLKVVSIFQFF